MTRPPRQPLAHLLRLAACVLMLAAAAIPQSGKLFGRPLVPAPAGGVPAASGDTVVLDSSALAPGVVGYGGPVPVEVEARDGRVVRVSPVLPNDETPMFFGLLDEAGLWHAWDDLPLAAAATAGVEAVTSATYSSRAAIANARAAISALAGATAPAPPPASRPPLRTLAALAVLLAAAILPWFVRSRAWRTVQLVLDVAVLGAWNGLFLSVASLVGWADGDLPPGAADLSAVLLLLAMAFLYPLFGRSSHYCLHVCPFGALQELASRIPARRIALPPRLVRALTAFRRALWAALMLALWCGVGSRALGWELFGAFAWRAVPPLVTALALAFVVLSVFVPRPYCRFACPTGTLLKLAESTPEPLSPPS